MVFAITAAFAGILTSDLSPSYTTTDQRSPDIMAPSHRVSLQRKRIAFLLLHLFTVGIPALIQQSETFTVDNAKCFAR
jgi:hypothetical protein